MPSSIIAPVVGLVSTIIGGSAAKKKSDIQEKADQAARDRAKAQKEYDIAEAKRIRDEEVAAEKAATEEKRRQGEERVAAEEEAERERLAEEERVRLEEERRERERFASEKRSAWSEYGLEVQRLSKESDQASVQAEEEIDASRMRTRQAQEDISKHEEVVSAAQTVGFAARGLSPGSKSATAVMKYSADLAESERMKLQENFELFGETRRKEAIRVKESAEMSLQQLRSRIRSSEGKGRLALQHMRERGDIAAEVGEFSLKQFKASNTRELAFASKFLDMDIAAATRRGEKADRAIRAMEENEQYISTMFDLKDESTKYSQRYNTLGMVTGIAGKGVDIFTNLKKSGFFNTPKSPFFTSHFGTSEYIE